jgi:hypothetical protein
MSTLLFLDYCTSDLQDEFIMTTSKQDYRDKVLTFDEKSKRHRSNVVDSGKKYKANYLATFASPKCNWTIK